jgi:hypothetical protein
MIQKIFKRFFLNAYQPAGYELAVELTFPISEGISCGILNASSIVIKNDFIFIYILLNFFHKLYFY